MENKKQEYNKMYYQKNKERISKNQKTRYQQNLEINREKRKKYYQENKDNILASNKKWRENNRDRFKNMINARRKEIAEELKAKGQMFTHQSRTQRENKMVDFLSKKMGYSIEQSRKLLIENDWNIKKLLGE